MKKIFFLTTALIVLLSAPCFGGEWNLTGSLNQSRSEFCSVILDDGRVLVAGGTGTGGPYNSVEVWDPNTEQWTLTNPMNYHRKEFSMTKLADGKILAAGGYGLSGEYPGCKTEIWDPNTEEWTETANLNNYHGAHAAILLENGQVLVVGGGSSTDYKACEIYDPLTNTWTLTGFCHWPKVDHTIELLPDGQVMAIAGGSSVFNKAEIWNPNTGLWTETANLNLHRDNHTSHILSNGNVMVIGGSGYAGAPQFLASCEIYDFATEQWTFTDSLSIGRSTHCSKLLLNNKVLTMGGTPGGSEPRCEIYHENEWQVAASTYYPYGNFSSEVLNDERVLAIRSWCEIYTWNHTPFDSLNPIGGNAWGIGEEVEFSITPSDPDQDSISVRFNWGDGNITQWTELVASGTTLTFSHSWGEEGNYNVRAQVRDQWHLLNEQCHNSLSEWSDPVIISITGNPVIEIDSNPINFGQVLIGSDSTVSIFISNSGNGTLEGQVSTESPFSVDPEDFLISPQGNEKEIFITFSPTSTGLFEKILLIQSNDPENPEIEILLSGEGVAFNSVTDPVLNIASISAYPNPFNSTITISFSLAQVGPRQVKILIYNIKGQVVKTWALDPSTTQVTWRGRDENGNPVSSGIYFYRIKAGDYRPSGKVILLK